MRLRSAIWLPAALAAAVSLHAQPPRDLVVGPKWLADHLRDPDLVVLQVGPAESYAKGHVPGARHVDLQMIDANQPRDPNRLTLEMPAAADLRGRLENLGISDGSRIVVVETDEWFSPSTRVVFTLQYAGFGDRVSWLDGGLAGWVAAGYQTSTAAAPATRGRITRAAVPGLIVDHAFVGELGAPRPGVRLIDGRAPVFFAGPGQTMNDHTMKAGHIPGAANIPFNTLVGDHERLRSRDELAGIFRAAGVQPGDTVVAYCHVGQQATLVLFAARLLGHPVRLYDGSMDDWERRGHPTVGGTP
ncbi:MAG: sulfurtransferase [Gemmatimonadales bacterium]